MGAIPTYKLALGACLSQFAQQDQTTIRMPDLAAAFFDVYADRLKNGKPQLLHPSRQTVMEQIVSLHTLGKLDRAAAVRRVEQEAFDDVIPRFHTVHHGPVGTAFYHQTPRGLVLTDALFTVFQTPTSQHLLQELDARWSLLEGAFEQRCEQSELANDIRMFYLQRGYERRPLTALVPVLHGYQDGCCFYCGEVLVAGSIDVDHVIPRQILYHDKVWNLVLAHSFCNNQKSDLLPGLTYLEKLVARNKRLIASTHLIRERVIQVLGKTPKARRQSIRQPYADAQIVIPTTWEGTRGYNPATDPFYQRVVRSLNT